jgi:hypothetical protein
MSVAPTITISPRAVVAALVALAMMLGCFAMAPAIGGPLSISTASAQGGSVSGGGGTKTTAGKAGNASATDVGSRLGEDIAGGVKGLVYAIVAAVFVIAIVRREVAGAMVAAALGILALMILNPDFMDSISGGLTNSITGK